MKTNYNKYLQTSKMEEQPTNLSNNDKIKIHLKHILETSKCNYKIEIMKQLNLKRAHIYCKIHQLSGQVSGPLIEHYIKNKYGMTDSEIEAAIAGEYEGDIKTDLIGRLDLLNKSQNLFNKRKKAADVIFDRKIEERKEKALEKQNQERIARETRQKAEAARKNQTYTGGSDRQNVVDRNTGRRDATGGDRGSRGASDQFSNRSGRGRTGY